jgi:ABC-2 type transport system permease protein
MWVIASREYLAAVRTKTFLIGLLLMPIMMAGSGLMTWLLKDVVDLSDRKFVLVDRTPGKDMEGKVAAAVEKHNHDRIKDPISGQQIKPRFVVDAVAPSSDKPDAMAQQRLELSEKVRQGKLSGFLEVAGREVFPPAKGGASVFAPDLVDEAKAPVVLRYQTNRPADQDFAKYVKKESALAIREDLARKANLKPELVDTLIVPVTLDIKGLTTRDPETGAIREATEQSQIASLLIPAGLMMLMFMVVLMGATPLMQGVVEEKMQRIAEVLLGSVQPFALMMGKLLGMVGVSLTISTVYLGGAYWAAQHYGYSEFLSADLLASFVLFQCLASLMYGSLFIAIGAACTDMKETQNLLWPVMLLAMLPLFVVGNVMREPNSPVATGLSFFPFSTPMLMIARQAVPPGLPWWQPAAGVVLVLVTTLLCVYAAGRIFRVGILMQGKGARIGELLKWVVRG